MSIFNRKKVSDRENAALWRKEAERLNRERNELLEKLNSIEQYKEDYEGLIHETEHVKERYEILTAKVEGMFEEYKKKIEEVVKAGK